VILSVGEALAEFMRTRPGVPLDRTGELAGPFPGGAPAIFASVAARLGGRSALSSVVGDDPFGVLLRRRLESDGVDVSGLRTDRGATTACAFVSYDERGERTFVFHVAQAAAGCLREDNLADLPERASWMHVSGATVALSQAMANVVDVAVARVKRAGGRNSLDPNVRAGAGGHGVVERIARIASEADVLLPSEGELEVLGLTEDAAPVVCTTLGAGGARVRWQGVSDAVPAVEAREVDPTGAGDTFAAAFVVASVAGAEPVEAAREAVWVAAASVEHLGGMEAPVTRRRA
jgi:tagatose kinase